MRIITGDLKGRRLYSPTDNKIRPTSDKVKESIFNMIAEYTEDAIVIDLFCGTGNMGLEAISRGARRVYFIDKARESILLTKKNIAHCKSEDKAILIGADYERGLTAIKEKVDLIFLDPPYKAGYLEDCIKRIDKASLLAPRGILVCEHSSEERLPDSIESMVKLKEKRYGKSIVDLYWHNQEDNES